MQVKLVRKLEGLSFPRPHRTLDPRQGHLAPVPDKDAPPADEGINRFPILSHTLSTNMGFREERDSNLPSFHAWQVN